MAELIEGPTQSRDISYVFRGGFVIKEVAYSNCAEIIFVDFADAILRPMVL